MTDSAALRRLIRDIPDFPQAGVTFRDVTPLLAAAAEFAAAVDALAAPYADVGVSKVAGVEARGFLFAAPVALRLGAGVVPVRKVGKLPWRTVRAAYSLEYANAEIEIHEDGVTEGDRVLLVDDVLASGGTADAAARLLTSLGAEVLGASFLLELAELGGRGVLADLPVRSLVTY
jgi:adenine phosphoribosyltransferase